MTREDALKVLDTIPTIGEQVDALEMAIEALEQEPCEDCVSRQALKQKLQERHDFFVNAYGGFSNLLQNDKSRVDEITNCIAMVVNEPSVTPQPKTGRWIDVETLDSALWHACSECGETEFYATNFCPDCGAKMEAEE